MDAILKKIGVNSSFAQRLEDNYVYTEEELKILSLEDLREVFGPEEVELVLKWQRGEISTASSKDSHEKAKKTKTPSPRESDVMVNYETLDKLEEDKEKTVPEETAVRSTGKRKGKRREKEKNKVRSKSRNKKAEKTNETKISSNSNQSEDKVSKNGVKDEDSSQRISRTLNLLTFQYLSESEKIIKIKDLYNSESKKSDLSCNPVIKATDHKRQSFAQTKNSTVDCNEFSFAIDEIYENNIYADGEWKPCNKGGWYGFSDSSGKIDISKIKIDDLKTLGICCSKWRWLSEWVIDGSGVKGDDGWTFSATYDSRNFKSTEKGSNNFLRRRRLCRVRFLDIPFLFNNKYEYEGLKRLITEIIIKFGVKTSSREKIFTDQDQFVKKYTSLYDLQQMTKFKRDVFMLLNESEKMDRAVEAERIYNRLQSLFSDWIFEDKKSKEDKALEKIEELIDSISLYKSTFSVDNFMPIYVTKFLISVVEENVHKFEDDQFLCMDKLFCLNKKDTTPEKLHFNPISLIKQMLFPVLFRLENVNRDSVEFATLAEVCEKTMNSLRACIKNVYEYENVHLSESIGEACKTLIMLDSMNKFLNEVSVNIIVVLKTTIVSSFQAYYRKKRLQYPTLMEDFLEDDWVDFGNSVFKILLNEVNFYLPNLFIPNILEHPGENTISILLVEFLSETNSLLSTKNPIFYTESVLLSALKQYHRVREFLFKEKSRLFLSDATFSNTEQMFISYKYIFTNKMEDILEDGFRKCELFIDSIYKEKSKLHKSETASGQSEGLNQYLEKITSMKTELFDGLGKFILSNEEILKYLDTFVEKLKAHFDKVVDAFFSPAQLKKNVVCNFFTEEKKVLEVPENESVTKSSDLFRVLDLNKEVREIEELPPSVNKLPSMGMTSITTKLCVFFGNIFRFLEAIVEFKHSLELCIDELVSKKLIKEFKFDLPMTDKFLISDTLIQIISLRVVMLESRGLLHKLYDKYIAQDILVESISYLTEILATLSMYMNRNSLYNLVESIIVVFCKSTYWLLLCSNRSFKKTHTEVLKNNFEEVFQLLKFFLPPERQKTVDSHADAVEKTFHLMSLDDSELFAVFRKLRDKGLAGREMVAKKGKTVTSMQEVKEKEILTLTDFFTDLVKEEAEENEGVSSDKLTNNEVKLDSEAKKELLERILGVISRRRSDICRRFASDNGKKPPSTKCMRETDDEAEEEYSDEGNPETDSEGHAPAKKSGSANSDPEEESYSQSE